jgi:hypothetical protein
MVTFAVGGQFLDYGELVSYDNSGAADGKFHPSERVFSAAWALSLGRYISIGAAGKSLMMKLDSKGSAWAADAGMLARYSIFTLGASVKNMNRGIRINEVKEALPRTVRAGARVELGRVALLSDMGSGRNGSWTSAGAEYALLTDFSESPILLRGGYTTRADTARYNFTAGIGVREGGWGLDYALVPYGDLGLTHHLTVSFSFAGRRTTGVPIRNRDAGSLTDRPGPQSGELILIPAEFRVPKTKR